MLSNLIVALEAVVPVFVLIGIGMAVRKAGIVNETENKHFNRLIFLVFFPTLMFQNLYGTDIREAANPRLIGFGVVSVLLIFAAAVLVVTRVEKNPHSRGAMIQAIFRSNFVLMGIPVATNICGHGNIAATAIMVAVIVPLFNVLAVITLEIFRGGRVSAGHIVVQIIKNPIIIGAVAGIIVSLAGIHVPDLIESIIDEMSQVTTPMALIILGASFSFSSIKRCRRNLIISVVGKLVVVPAVFLPLAAFAGFRGVEFVTLIAVFAAPAAVSSFTMAEAMDSDSELAGNCVIFSSLFAGITLFLWIFIFKSLEMF